MPPPHAATRVCGPVPGKEPAGQHLSAPPRVRTPGFFSTTLATPSIVLLSRDRFASLAGEEGIKIAGSQRHSNTPYASRLRCYTYEPAG